MMLKYSFELPDAAEAIDDAVTAVLDSGIKTGDIASAHEDPVTTSQMGDAIAVQILQS